MASPPSGILKYWAFISYSSRNKKWGSWLRKAIENHPIPKEYREQRSFDGAALGKYLRPCFRDRDELAGSADLGAAISTALDASRHLVVLCSPDSARSKWVNQEIEDFKARGGEKRILALILEGEPNATTAVGVDSALECFPPALRYPLEPLAGDLRKEGDGKQRGLLKVVSGLSGIPFDTLYRRHEKAQRRRRLIALVSAVGIIGMLTALSVFALIQREIATTERNTARETLIATHLNQGVEKAEQGNSPAAAAWLAHALRLATEARSSQQELIRTRLSSLLSSGEFVIPGGTLDHQVPVERMRFSPSGKFLATLHEDQTVQLWTHQEGIFERRGPPIPFHGSLDTNLSFCADESQIAIVGPEPNTVEVRETASLRRVGDPVRFDQPVALVSWAVDEAYLLAGMGAADDRFVDEVALDSLRIIDRGTGAEQLRLSWEAQHFPGSRAITVSPRRDYARAGKRLVHLRPPFENRELPFDWVAQVAFPAEGGMAYVAGSGGDADSFYALDLKTLKKVSFRLAEVGQQLEDGRLLVNPSGTTVIQEQTWALTGERRGYLVLSVDPPTSLEIAEGFVARPHVRELGLETITPNRAGDLFCADKDRGVIQIVDGESGRGVRAPIQHQDLVRQSLFAPDDASLLSLTAGGRVRIWHLDGLREQPGPVPLPKTVAQRFPRFAYLDSSSLLGDPEHPIISDHGSLTLEFSRNYEDDSGTTEIVLTRDSSTEALTFQEDGTWIVRGGFSPGATFIYYQVATAWEDEGRTTIRRTDTGEVAFTAEGHFLGFDEQEERIILQQANLLKVLRIQDGSPAADPINVSGPVEIASISPGGTLLAFGMRGTGPETSPWGSVWNLTTGNEIMELAHEVEHGGLGGGVQAIVALAFSSDEKRLATLAAQHDGDGDYEFAGWNPTACRIWDLPSGLPCTEWLAADKYQEDDRLGPDELRHTTEGTERFHRKPVIQFSPGSQDLIWTIADTPVLSWDYDRTVDPKLLIEISETLSGLAVSESTSRIVLGSNDERPRRWRELMTQPGLLEFLSGSRASE